MNQNVVEAVRAQFPPFVGFPSIPRLFRNVVITEKIDGTNASVQVNEDGTVWAASRTRYITPESDNFGFATWVKAHEEELKQLGAGRHFGEWYGSGIQRAYGLTNGERRFALFNTGRWWSHWNDRYVAEDAPVMSTPPACCGVVPILWKGTFGSKAALDAAQSLIDFGSLVVPGFREPEGIVVYHTKSKQSYKYTFDKNDGHKTT